MLIPKLKNDYFERLLVHSVYLIILYKKCHCETVLLFLLYLSILPQLPVYHCQISSVVCFAYFCHQDRNTFFLYLFPVSKQSIESLFIYIASIDKKLSNSYATYSFFIPLCHLRFILYQVKSRIDVMSSRPLVTQTRPTPVSFHFSLASCLMVIV